MTPVSIVCFSILALLFVSMFRKGTDVLSPARLFLIIWLIAIGLADLKLSRFQFEWSAYSWLTLLVPILSMLLGMFFVYVINYNKKIPKISSVRAEFRSSDIDGDKFFFLIMALFVLYCVSFITTYMIRGFLPMFTKMPEVARTKWGVFGYGVFVLSIPSILYFSLAYIFLVPKNFSKKIIVSLIIIVGAVSYSTLLQRFYLLLPIIFLLILFYYMTKKMKPRNVLIFFVVFFALFYGISTIRMSRYAFDILYYLSDMKYGSQYAVFTEPYMYVTMNLENYAKAVQNLNQYTYGFFTADFLLFAVRLKPIIQEYVNIPEFPSMISNAYNTYSMFFIYYRDFGFVGVFAIPMILGFGINTLYYWMRKRPDMNSISIYALCIIVIIFSFFIPILHWIHFTFNIIIIYSVTKMIQKKKEGITNTGSEG